MKAEDLIGLLMTWLWIYVAFVIDILMQIWQFPCFFHIFTSTFLTKTLCLRLCGEIPIEEQCFGDVSTMSRGSLYKDNSNKMNNNNTIPYPLWDLLFIDIIKSKLWCSISGQNEYIFVWNLWLKFDIRPIDLLLTIAVHFLWIYYITLRTRVLKQKYLNLGKSCFW